MGGNVISRLVGWMWGILTGRVSSIRLRSETETGTTGNSQVETVTESTNLSRELEEAELEGVCEISSFTDGIPQEDFRIVINPDFPVITATGREVYLSWWESVKDNLTITPCDSKGSAAVSSSPFTTLSLEDIRTKRLMPMGVGGSGGEDIPCTKLASIPEVNLLYAMCCSVLDLNEKDIICNFTMSESLSHPHNIFYCEFLNSVSFAKLSNKLNSDMHKSLSICKILVSEIGLGESEDLDPTREDEFNYNFYLCNIQNVVQLAENRSSLYLSDLVTGTTLSSHLVVKDLPRLGVKLSDHCANKLFWYVSKVLCAKEQQLCGGCFRLLSAMSALSEGGN